MEEKRGLLLINLGTPEAPTEQALKPYLTEFLGDRFVLRMPAIFRWFLVNVLIVPSRSKKSAKLYQNIWTERGSPLLYHSQDFAAKVSAKLQGKMTVALAMRYGKPSIEAGLKELRDAGCTKIVVFPLYPHYALSSVATCLEKVKECWKGSEDDLSFVPEFFADIGYLDALAETVKAVKQKYEPEYVLFSYHGLPESHIKATDPSGKCLKDPDCCTSFMTHAPHCYRAQCFYTTKYVVKKLKIDANQHSSAFQSRLGISPWLQPYTDYVLNELAQKGVKKLAVVCPAFTADCLETLEEITIRAREQFIGAGGEDVYLVPALNDSESWVEVACRLAQGATVKPFRDRPTF